jgi:hypothetical protein
MITIYRGENFLLHSPFHRLPDTSSFPHKTGSLPYTPWEGNCLLDEGSFWRSQIETNCFVHVQVAQQSLWGRLTQNVPVKKMVTSLWSSIVPISESWAFPTSSSQTHSQPYQGVVERLQDKGRELSLVISTVWLSWVQVTSFPHPKEGKIISSRNQYRDPNNPVLVRLF